MERFRGGLVCKAHRLLYDSTLGSRVIKKRYRGGEPGQAFGVDGLFAVRYQLLDLQWRGLVHLPLGFGVQGSRAALKERCPPRQKSIVERLKAKVEPLLN